MATTTPPPGWQRQKISDSVLEHIGCTPMIRLNAIAREAGLKCELLAKCEFMNAGGSVKDRIGKRMIEEAEKSGRIKPGDTLIEPTSGNTGIGLAMTGAIKGYNVVITLPEKMSDEKCNMLKGLGAEIVRTPTEAAWDSPESHIGVAARLQQELPNAHILDQYANRANPDAHYHGTAEEILYQCDGRVDMVVIGAGTGGTISGVARKLRERSPSVTVVGVDPIGSILAQPESLNKPGPSYLVEGIGYDFIPDVLDRSLIDKWVKTHDEASLKMARRLIKQEGLLAGGSSGAAVAAAIEAAKNLGAGQRCVVVLPDSTRNYMSKFLDDEWMVDKGFEPATILNNGAAVGAPARPSEWWESRSVAELDLPKPMTVAPTMPCTEAIAIMNAHGFDQLPVVDPTAGVLGVVALGDATAKILAHRVKPQQPVSSLMFTSFRQVAPSAPLAALSHVFKRHSFCLVVSTDERFKKKAVVGVCTPIDLLKFVVDDKGKLPSLSASRQEAYPIATEPARQAEETARDLGCSAYIWSAIKHKKTPVNSPFSSPVVRAMEAPMPPKLQLDELERAAATPIGGTCPTQMGGTGGFDCAGYVWGFVKNKTPIASPMPSLKSSPMNSPAVAATTGVGAVPAMPTV